MVLAESGSAAGESALAVAESGSAVSVKSASSFGMPHIARAPSRDCSSSTQMSVMDSPSRTPRRTTTAVISSWYDSSPGGR
ncbi:hypothetical protein BBK82_30055 [Lentzea guizhouensis]|uniref:Uncharacterized protein n=1 Tax=Lentzea guizhouensis TaxID=1586287 RepID=A0A1B2HPM8_9PSEU|nr:hypothetical protein [Lentzea guizhouensis]ANZ39656.1 hypothetical protein BBK82_30055 [Lentzea guizhouensis]